MCMCLIHSFHTLGPQHSLDYSQQIVADAFCGSPVSVTMAPEHPI